MIAIDTSALLAILLKEREAEACIAALEQDHRRLISAGTVTEALIVAGGKSIGRQMSAFLEQLGVEIVSVTGESARRAAVAYARWGKGVHPAGLNFGDCFAYALAEEYGCRLLCIGNDFRRTDVEAVP